METMERDPQFIEEGSFRKMFRLTQENLADAAGLTTRTIEKVESGRHRPDEYTLRCIARAVKIDVGYFAKPTAEEEARQHAEIERASRKIVAVPTNPIRKPAEFLAAFGGNHAIRFDTSQVEADEALEVAASLVELVKICLTVGKIALRVSNYSVLVAASSCAVSSKNSDIFVIWDATSRCFGTGADPISCWTRDC